MATNPLYNTNDSPNSSTQPTKAVNKQSVYVPRTHNNFDMSYFHYMTQKFGFYDVPFVMEAVPGDRINLSSSHNVRALPLNSPFMDSLRINKDYFLCPNNAIQPNTWDLIYKLPSQGDDIPSNAHNTFRIFLDENTFFLDPIFYTILDSEADESKRVWSLLIAELFVSSGSLLYKMGYKLNPTISFFDDSEVVVRLSFDQFFDRLFLDCGLSFSIETSYFSGTFTTSDSADPDIISIDKYTALSLIRRFGSFCTFEEVNLGDSWNNFDYSISGLPSPSADRYTDSIDINRLCAYQLCCAQYYVNPQVDFLYNAQLYRDNVFSLYQRFFNDSLVTVTPYFFGFNGIRVQYDYFSHVYYENFSQSFFYGFSSLSLSSITKGYDYLNSIFGWRESLRFGDYFTDSRTRPLAIGDDSVNVRADNSISVIDTSRQIIIQRFRNAVVKLGNNIGDYLRGIFGEDMSPDYHIPKFIIHQDFAITGQEIANTTTDSQGSLVTNLNTADDTSVFDIEIDMPCIILGTSYFSVPRTYCQTKERFFFHRDRYDFFNPMLQYIGDQPVFNQERTDLRPSNEVFGYQSRHNEYKQRYSVVSGGFVSSLPAWTFVSDSIFNPVTDVVVSDVQSPDYIRACDYEFNRFLSSIPGFSMSTGFHFIVRYNHKVNAIRPMEVNPSTL